jgi:hypothetical protein
VTKAWPVDDVDPDKSLAFNARRILGVRMAEYFSYTGVVPLEHAIEPLHNLRISAKRLRYTLELFRMVFGDLGKVQIDRIKAIQGELGELHDHDVRIALILDELQQSSAEQITALGRKLAESLVVDHAAIAATVLRPPPDDPRRGLIALLGREHALRSERYQSFKRLWDQQLADGVRADLARLSTGDPELARSSESSY